MIQCKLIGMDMDEYQELAMRTRNKELSQKDMIVNAAMGLNGEAGEFIDIIKKHMFQGHALNTDKLIDELSDILWYCALAAEGLGVNLSEVAEYNVDKLKARYPDGFDAQKSVCRKGNV